MPSSVLLKLVNAARYPIMGSLDKAPNQVSYLPLHGIYMSAPLKPRQGILP